MEQMDYNLLFRWFVGLGIDDAVWDASTFSKNRDRLLEGDIAQALLAQIVSHPRVAPLLSREHFSVDGTLIEAWASHKSFVPKNDPDSSGPGRNVEKDFRGERRGNETHASTTADARLYKKSSGSPAILCFMGHALIENRHGLVVDGKASYATGTAERMAALDMAKALPGRHRKTLGADKAYDTRDFVDQCRQNRITPHIACHDKRHGRSAIDRRVMRHAGYAVSQKKRKLVEEVFGWGKSVGAMAKTKFRGLARVGGAFTLNLVAYNVIRLPKLMRA